LQAEVVELFEQIVPGPAERLWLLETLAARFIGENRPQKIIFGKGPASNGKSILISLCRLIFGDYQRILPKEVLMGKGMKPGQATPEIAQLRGVRLVFAAEPALTDSLNESLAKTLSGDEELCVRPLYSASFNMKIQFMLFFMTNHLIRIPADGDGIWRRLQVMPFTSLFTDFPEQRRLTYTEGAVFRKNPLLKQRLPVLRDAATTYLVRIALRTKGHTNECQLIEDLTKEYRLHQDRVAVFIDSRIQRKDGNRVPVSTLRGAVKEWHRGGTEASLDINMVVDRLMKEPYNYAFNPDRKMGYNFEIMDAFTILSSGEQPRSNEQEFLEAFAICHEATLDENDYVPFRDVAVWASHNLLGLRNTAKMLDLVRTTYFPMGITEVNRRIPKRNGRKGSESRDIFVGLKRKFWHQDGTSPVESVAGDLNSEASASDVISELSDA
jgi:P4 family phage/plasmid primase-like protien